MVSPAQSSLAYPTIPLRAYRPSRQILHELLIVGSSAGERFSDENDRGGGWAPACLGLDRQGNSSEHVSDVMHRGFSPKPWGWHLGSNSLVFSAWIHTSAAARGWLDLTGVFLLSW